MEYDDGSYIVSMGGPEYEHVLMKDYVVRVYNPFCIYFLPTSDFLFLPKEASSYFVYSYSFSTDGFITGHIFQKSDRSDNTIRLLVDGSENFFAKEFWFIFDITAKQNNIFYNRNEYEEYCNTHHIVFLSKFFYAPFKGDKENDIIISNDVMVKRNSYYQTDIVCWKGKDVVCGTIRKYAILSDYVVFYIDFDKMRFSVEDPDSVNLSVPNCKKKCYVAVNVNDGNTYYYDHFWELYSECQCSKLNWLKVKTDNQGTEGNH